MPAAMNMTTGAPAAIARPVGENMDVQSVPFDAMHSYRGVKGGDGAAGGGEGGGGDGGGGEGVTMSVPQK